MKEEKSSDLQTKNNGKEHVKKPAEGEKKQKKPIKKPKPKKEKKEHQEIYTNVRPARSYENADNEDEILEEISSEASKKTKQKKRKKNKALGIKLKGDEQWQKDLTEIMKANELSHQKRLEPWKDKKSVGSVKITPLGGLGQIGANITVVETQTSAIVIDVGMSFPDDSMHGVDIVVPDFSYIRKIKDKIKAVIITHAHEDHIGAMPYFYKEFNYPIYATPLPLGMIANKFEEHGLKDKKSLFRPVEKRKVYKIDEFEIEFIHITHSIIDSSALAIKTPAGVIFHTGDFKIDYSPIDGYPMDLHRIAEYGEKGVLCLLSDSTNSHREGVTKSESVVGGTFDKIFSKAKGRVIMSTFSSNIHRIYQAIEYGAKYGRRVCVIGRSMERNLYCAMELGYIKLDKKLFIDADELAKHPNDKILIVTTGSQGESMSALYRMAINEHRHVSINEEDTIIISAKAIPGNETSVNAVIDLLLRGGASVAYHEFSEIHVSGHAAQEEQKLMIRLVKPKFFLPVHGEYNHILRHKQTAIECGVDEKNILLMGDGDQIEVNYKGIRKVGAVKVGRTYIDNQVDREIYHDLLNTRQNLANHGLVQVHFSLNQDTKMVEDAKVLSFGIISNRFNDKFAKDTIEHIKTITAGLNEKVLDNFKNYEAAIKAALKKYYFKQYKKYPILVVDIVKD